MKCKRPNFLIVMVEHFSGLAVPNGGTMAWDAAALEALADRAVRFDRAYCNAPVCGPSRMSFCSGRYACNVEAYDNGSALPGHVPTFGHLLTRAGYRTAMCGRMHVHGLDQHQGFEQRLCSEIINPIIACPADWPAQHLPLKPIPPVKPGLSHQLTFRDDPIFGHDRYVTERACEYLAEAGGQAPGEQPFCLVVGYFGAHLGSTPNPEHQPFYEKYRKRKLPLPEFSEDDYKKLPEHARRLHQLKQSDSRIFSPEYHHETLAGYFARLEFLDHQLGELLAGLHGAGLDDRTVVIFTSDHGDNMGRHGLWGKMNFYEEAERVPLYVRMPGARSGQGSVVTQAVSLVDIVPTLAELAGTDVPVPIDGRSLAPLLNGATPGSDDAVVFSEYHGYLCPSDMYMVVQGRSKYCHYLLEPCELFDLEADPQETRNLIDHPDHAAAQSRLEQELRRIVDVQAMGDRIREYNCQRQAVYDALTNSAVHQQLTEQRHEAFRASRNEPWWDGGRYLAAGEKSSKRSDAGLPETR